MFRDAVVFLNYNYIEGNIWVNITIKCLWCHHQNHSVVMKTYNV